MMTYEEADSLYGLCECVNGLDHCHQHLMDEHRVRPDIAIRRYGRELCYWCSENCDEDNKRENRTWKTGMKGTAAGVNLLKPKNVSPLQSVMREMKQSEDSAGEMHWSQEAFLPRIGLVAKVDQNTLTLHGAPVEVMDVIRFLGSRNQALWIIRESTSPKFLTLPYGSIVRLEVLGAPADYPLRDVVPGVAFEIQGSLRDFSAY